MTERGVRPSQRAAVEDLSATSHGSRQDQSTQEIPEVVAEIVEMSIDQGAQTETFVQLAREQQPSIGRHRRAPELNTELRVEREADRAGLAAAEPDVPNLNAVETERSERRPP